MLKHVDPAEIPTFKAAVEAQFGTESIAFLEPVAHTPAETVELEPTAPTAPEATPETDTEPAIDVEVATDAPIETTPEATTPEATTGIERLLGKMSIQNIRKLASAKGIDAKGTRANIAARLKTLVTESDIWNATT